MELEGRGVGVHRSSVAPLLHRQGLSHKKKTLRASEQERPDIQQARQHWRTRRKTFFDQFLTRLVFIDETSTNTRLTKRAGWAPDGAAVR